MRTRPFETFTKTSLSAFKNNMEKILFYMALSDVFAYKLYMEKIDRNLNDDHGYTMFLRECFVFVLGTFDKMYQFL